MSNLECPSEGLEEQNPQIKFNATKITITSIEERRRLPPKIRWLFVSRGDTLRTVHQASLQASLRRRPSIMQADIVSRSYKWAMTPRNIDGLRHLSRPQFIHHPPCPVSSSGTFTGAFICWQDSGNLPGYDMAEMVA
ncbi:hypothetical protein CEXT_93921 [Caerostris extrusa]|uniref:Uncharacterized protein n=1 Tax=Caerostris extrusa TaxID=172846 RepID=A0AAV4TD17_CAEEX|nr:hypothetical protein CEXT_93921 [Caerostris extrusa]